MHTEEIKSKHEESVPSLVATGEEEVRVFLILSFLSFKRRQKKKEDGQDLDEHKMTA